MCSVQGCAKQPPTKEPLGCLALECQPVAGVRGRATPLPSSPRPPPQPHCLPGLAYALVPAPGPAVCSLACPCSQGHSLTRPYLETCLGVACRSTASLGSRHPAPDGSPHQEGAGGSGRLPRTGQAGSPFGGKAREGEVMMEAELASLSPLPYYSAAAQVHRPGPAQPSVPGGDRPRLVWEDELLSPGSVGAEAGSVVPFAWQVEQVGCLPSPGVFS